MAKSSGPVFLDSLVVMMVNGFTMKYGEPAQLRTEVGWPLRAPEMKLSGMKKKDIFQARPVNGRFI